MNISLPVINSVPENKIKSLLNIDSNYKLRYSAKKSNSIVAGLSLRPAYKVIKNGKTILNTCSHATKSCKSVCVLEKHSCSVFLSVKKIRVEKTNLLANNPIEFRRILINDINKIIYSVKAKARKTKKKQKKINIRLNVASDINYFTHPILKDIFDIYKNENIHFYDYTKDISRLSNKLPSNYHLVYSLNELSNMNKVHEILEKGFNVACIFDTYYNKGHKNPLPKNYNLGGRSFKVVDGDFTDIRSKSEGQGVIIGLRFKGSNKNKIKAIESGFCLKG